MTRDNTPQGGGELVPVSGAELVPATGKEPDVRTDGRLPSRHRVVNAVGHAVGKAKASPRWAQARSVAAYRTRKAPRDLLRLLWFWLRGHRRWAVKVWTYLTHGDLRADVRAARLAGDAEARRAAQEAMRADGKARWAKLGIALLRAAYAAGAVVVLLVLLALLDLLFARATMPEWLQTAYDVRNWLGNAIPVALAWMVPLGLVAWTVAAVWEGRDRTPGAGWLTQPDRDDADSWVDERMISKALAHLGIGPLNAFFKDGGELIYLTPARRDGDGTAATVRLPLGVTADMVADRRSTLAANLGRASLETWPTKGDEDGVLDLWVADKGKLSGGAGLWPLLHDGGVDLFDGVPFGITQRGIVVNAPLFEANWLIGGRPGQGKTSAMRTLMLGAALDPTAELWVYVMGQSPDFDPLAPRLSRYAMGMDDRVAEAAVQALADLSEEMERRGKALGAQPGRPPKVSRKLADRPGLGLHPLVLAIDECHELFQHKQYGRQAEELAVRLIKRGRKYGITLVLATQSPTKDSIPKEITRNVSCGMAFAVADHVANDGLLGSGKYKAGIRATELRMKTDRGTCVAVGVTDEPWELVHTFYVPFEDGFDQVTPVVDRALALLDEHGRDLARTGETVEEESEPADLLADITDAMDGEQRLRTQVVLARLAALDPNEYDGWTLTDLKAAVAEYGITPSKSHGVRVLRAADIAEAIRARDNAETAGDPPGSRGVLPGPPTGQTPRADQRKGRPGSPKRNSGKTRQTPGKHGPGTQRGDSLPDGGGGGDGGG